MKNYLNKQNVLKGLLLLVLGLNYSWQPLMKGLQATTMASESCDGKAPAAKAGCEALQKNAAAAANAVVISGGQDPKNVIDQKAVQNECAKNLYLTQFKDGHFGVSLKDSNNQTEVICPQCTATLFQNTKNDTVDSLKGAIAANCSKFVSKEDLDAIAAEDQRHKLAMLKCEEDTKGNSIEGNALIKCRIKNSTVSAKALKDAGVTDKDEQNAIRKDNANNAVASVSALCRKKKSDDNEDCRDYADQLGTAMDKMSSFDGLDKVAALNSKKADKLTKYADARDAIDEKVNSYQTKFEKLTSDMNAAVASYRPSIEANCNQYGNAYSSRFDTQACIDADVAKVKEKYYSQFRSLSSSYVADETSLKSKLTALKGADSPIGADSVNSAVQPMIDFQTQVASSGRDSGIPARYLPVDSSSNTAGTTPISQLSNFYSIRSTTQPGGRTNAAFTAPATMPSIFSGGQRTQVYQRQQPAMTRATVLMPVQQQSTDSGLSDYNYYIN